MKFLIMIFLFLSFQPLVQADWFDWFNWFESEPCTKLCDKNIILDPAITTEYIQQLIDEGHDVNAYNKAGSAPLHYAVINRLDIVEVLLKNGADVHIRTKGKRNYTPIIIVALLMHTLGSDPKKAERIQECANLLLDYGASLEDKNKDGETAEYLLKNHLPSSPFKSK